MSETSPRIGSVAGRRRRIVLAAAHKRRPTTLAELRRMPEVALWQPGVLDATIDALIADGQLVDSAGPGEQLLVLEEGRLL
jgi:hypothetical protein